MTNYAYWNDKVVLFYLEEAAAIHRRLPEVKVQGYRSLWPATFHDDSWHRYYDILHGKNTLGSPMPSEVSYHEKVMESLLLLTRQKQQTLWCRANKMPWTTMVREFGRSKTTLWREVKNSLDIIATHLNHIDPSGTEYLRLRSRAINGC